VEWEKGLVEMAQKRGKDLVLIFNIRAHDAEAQGLDAAALESRMGEVAHAGRAGGRWGQPPVGGAGPGGPGARERVTAFVQERIRLRQGRVLPSIPPVPRPRCHDLPRHPHVRPPPPLSHPTARWLEAEAVL